MTGAYSVQYCYGIARSFESGPPPELGGVGGATIRLLPAGSLVALVSSVPAAEFGEAALRTSLEDLTWLEAVARAHNDVVDWAAQRTATLPFRLATIYLDEGRVRAALEAHSGQLSAALDQIAGRAEWGVKVYTEPSKATEPATEAVPATGGGAGRSYLRRRMTQRRSGERAWEQAVEAARQVDTVLTEVAAGRRSHRPQSAELSKARGQNVLNVAYLVADGDSDAFLRSVERVRESAPDCRIEVTGPWAPYSFALDGVDAVGDDSEEGPPV